MQTGEGVIKFFEAFKVGQSMSLVKGWAVAGCDLLTKANSTHPRGTNEIPQSCRMLKFGLQF